MSNLPIYIDPFKALIAKPGLRVSYTSEGKALFATIHFDSFKVEDSLQCRVDSPTRLMVFVNEWYPHEGGKGFPRKIVLERLEQWGVPYSVGDVD